MANFNLVIDSKFEPFSFERYLQPYALYKEAYKEQEEALNTASEKAAELAELADAEGSRESYAAYKSYMDDLNAAVDELSTQGLSSPLSSTIFKLKPRYNTEMAPIKKALDRRERERLLQEQLEASNPSLRFSRYAAATGVDDYVNNPNLTYKSIDGNKIRENVFTIASKLSAEDTKANLEKVLGKDYYDFVQSSGFSSSAILAALSSSDKSEAHDLLNKILDQAVDASGVKEWRTPGGEVDQDSINWAYQQAELGLWGAVGTTTHKLTPNWRTQKEVDFNYAKKLKEIDKENENIPIMLSNGSLTGATISGKAAKNLPREGHGYVVMTPESFDKFMKGEFTSKPANTAQEQKDEAARRAKEEENKYNTSVSPGSVSWLELEKGRLVDKDKNTHTAAGQFNPSYKKASLATLLQGIPDENIDIISFANPAWQDSKWGAYKFGDDNHGVGLFGDQSTITDWGGDFSRDTNAMTDSNKPFTVVSEGDVKRFIDKSNKINTVGKSIFTDKVQGGMSEQDIDEAAVGKLIRQVSNVVGDKPGNKEDFVLYKVPNDNSGPGTQRVRGNTYILVHK